MLVKHYRKKEFKHLLMILCATITNTNKAQAPIINIDSENVEAFLRAFIVL